MVGIKLPRFLESCLLVEVSGLPSVVRMIGVLADVSGREISVFGVHPSFVGSGISMRKYLAGGRDQ